MAALGLSDKQLGLRMVVDNGKIVLTPKKIILKQLMSFLLTMMEQL